MVSQSLKRTEQSLTSTLPPTDGEVSSLRYKYDYSAPVYEAGEQVILDDGKDEKEPEPFPNDGGFDDADDRKGRGTIDSLRLNEAQQAEFIATLGQDALTNFNFVNSDSVDDIITYNTIGAEPPPPRRITYNIAILLEKNGLK
ncbi:hypothetical protein E8E14_008750 [Neopestalotiopsis sp. 37M]|nr:hypothetical protein E8E14_008750 [Neopestalotiopsis sp. 37M]